ncbi:hypothetical protein AGMMS49545_22920 [Betaproteobacteria bacterium]|nr:hypothetical protein AGMMS49545_22920 [Betaproteobacteria bacterium]GHU41251.1 hypothetical protein AGMMS50289_04090 [Betaproteobacteria bacterium]
MFDSSLLNRRLAQGLLISLTALLPFFATAQTSEPAPAPDAKVQVDEIKTVPHAVIKNGVTHNFLIPEVMFQRDNELMNLLLQSESVEDDEKQYWFDIYPSMRAVQIERLYTILNVENARRAAWKTVLTLAKKAHALEKLGHLPEAFAAYSELRDVLGRIIESRADEWISADEWVSATMLHQGIIRRRQGQFTEAIAFYDQVEQRFAQHKDPAIRLHVAEALGRKAFLLNEHLNNPAGALEICETILRRYCANQNYGDLFDDGCLDAKESSIEPLILLGRQAEAIKNIKALQKQHPKGYPYLPELSFLLWLIEPERHTTQDVLKAIRKNLSTRHEANWTFNAMRPFMEREPEPRKSQARCFADFFEIQRDVGRLKSCLRAISAS